MQRILAVAILLLAPAHSWAKCADQLYVFSGSVVDKKGVPVSGALVGVSWSENSRPTGPAMALTNREGRYSVPISFDTTSPGPTDYRYRCDGALDAVSIAAYSKKMRSIHLKVTVGPQRSINVPALELLYPIKLEPTWPD
jgi:protocatechuate 3,4-dioxygenase beta subunit